MAAPLTERLRQMAERWFISEPLLFALWSSHPQQPNRAIPFVRSGQGRIEYNPDALERLDTAELTEVMRCEVVRILLQHPYQRRGEITELHYLASQITLKEQLQTPLPLPTAAAIFGHHRYDRHYLEFYYQKLVSDHETTQPFSRTGHGPSGDEPPATDDLLTPTDPTTARHHAALWAENDAQQQQIQQQIRNCEIARQWGSISHALQEQIRATLKPRFRFQTVLKGFRASILSNRRRLTRMRPNRRYDFAYPGSRREFDTKLLIAVDVSGSVSRPELNLALSAVNRLFRYGIAQLDLITFDTEVRDQWHSLRRARSEWQLHGRGGTSFQGVVEYLDQSDPPYDGAIILTDGHAPPPTPPRSPTRLLWLINSAANYRSQAAALRPLGEVAVMEPMVLS